MVRAVLILLLLLVLPILLMGVGLWIGNKIINRGSERWEQLAAPPAQPVQIAFLRDGEVSVWAADGQLYTCSRAACSPETIARPEQPVVGVIYSWNSHQRYYRAADGLIWVCSEAGCEAQWWAAPVAAPVAAPPGQVTELNEYGRAQVYARLADGTVYLCSEQACEPRGTLFPQEVRARPSRLPASPPGQVQEQRGYAYNAAEILDEQQALLMADGSLWYWRSPGYGGIYPLFMIALGLCGIVLGLIVGLVVSVVLIRRWRKG